MESTNLLPQFHEQDQNYGLNSDSALTYIQVLPLIRGSIPIPYKLSLRPLKPTSVYLILSSQSSLFLFSFLAFSLRTLDCCTHRLLRLRLEIGLRIMMTKRISCLGFKNAVEPTTSPLDFSGIDEAVQIRQQSLVGHISTFTGGKKSILFKFLGVRGEDIENLVYFAEKSQEETIRTTQQLQNGDGPFAKLPWVKKSVDLMDLKTMDVNGSLTQFDYSKKANEEAISSTHSQCQHPVLPSRLDFFVPKKQRSNRGKATNTTSFSNIEKFGNSVLEDLKPSTYTTGFSKKFGNPVLKDVKPAEQVGHNRKCLKRCRGGIEIEEKIKAKRQKEGKIQNKKGLARLAEWSLEPPPNMPIEFKKLIEEMGGSQEKLLIQKIIFKTDLSKTHNRLQIPMNQNRRRTVTGMEDFHPPWMAVTEAE
ncbi:hypothetical protein SLEP1_g30869 [Rubroshorea leprosula]|uniref:Uncharacterized protein n=1 Tax=Rubroshorea leprosula TaxID=152421 RepID=A0AAV5K6W0_9ROSI|nr:hypothetical protein SLEP1_g30869 [Rubroshorea leprosula]